MSLLDQLRSMYGQNDEESRIQQMLQAQAPQLEMDPATYDLPNAPEPAASDYAQPQAAPPPSGGAPDVLSFVKELEQKGAFAAKDSAKPKGMVEAQRTVKSEEGGVPSDVRAQGVAVRGQAELDDAQILADRRRAEADELDKRIAEKKAEVAAENEKRQQTEAENAKRQERLRSQQQELASQADEPINPRRYIENMSFLGKASALLSAGIYGYLGGRGQPPVTETIMKMTSEDTAAQLSDRAANRERRNSLIDQYERQYGDTTLVAKRLDADKLHTLAKQADAEAQQAKSAELRASAEDIGKKLRNRVGVLHQEIQEATYGKPVETTTTYQPPKPRGGLDNAAAIKKALELDKLLEERGYTSEQRAGALKAGGLALPGGTSTASVEREQKEQALTDAKTKRDEGQGKALGAWRTIQALGDEAGLDREQDGSFKVEDTLLSRANLPELGEKISGAVGGATPIANARKVAIEALGRLESGGAIQKDEHANFAEMLGHASSRRQIADVLNRIQIVVAPRLKQSDADEEERKKRLAPRLVTGKVAVP